MLNFFLQLGHAPELSFAEIFAVRDRLKNGLSPARFAGDIAFIDSENYESALRLCADLGGTIRLCEIMVSLPDWRAGDDLADSLLHALQEARADEFLKNRSNRPLFGFSLIGDVGRLGKRHAVQKTLQDLARLLKNLLREQEVSTRFVLPTGEGGFSLNGAQVEKNELMQKGGEFVIHLSPDQGIILGVTHWIQPYEEYSQRDYGRPQRDARSGMLPPKLSRMLINLARTEETHSLLDPFCGSGSLIMEAALMGMQATGVDLSGKAVHDTKENWRWFREHAGNLAGTLQVMEGDARQLHKYLEPLSFDACVTEPYMGPPLKKPLRRNEFDQNAKELSELYLRALGEIRTVVKPGARVVFIVPRFKVEGAEKSAQLNILPALILQGYQLLDPLHGFIPVKRRATLLYARPQQVVQREVFVLRA